MKKFFFIVVCTIAVSCSQNKSEKEASSDSSSIVIKDTTSKAINYSEVTEHYIWTTEWDEKARNEEIKKLRPLSTDSVNANAIIHLTNNAYPKVILHFVKTSGDTIYVKIPASTYLTQQMGTTGAEMYLANATFNLTELPGIHYVNFDMAIGDHAEPGTYSRKDFLDKEIK